MRSSVQPKGYSGTSNYRDLLSVISTEDLKSPPKFTLIEGVGILKIYRAIVPNALAFVDVIIPGATEVMGKEIKHKTGIMFMLV